MTHFFLSYLKYQKRASLHTIKAYANDLQEFEDFLNHISEHKIQEATYREIRSWASKLSTDGLKPTSINRKLASLRAFYKFLLAEGHITQNPMLKVNTAKKPKRLPIFVREEVMDGTNNVENLFPAGFEGIRDRLVIEMLYGTGMRLAELLQLNDNDINLNTNEIKVWGKRNKQRIIPLNPFLKNLIEEYHSLKKKEFIDLKHEKFIVTNQGTPAYPMFIQRLVKKYLKLIGHKGKASPHVLRHTFATHLLNSGAELNAVKELLGHASLAATQVYTHNTVEKLKKVYQQAHPKA